MRCLGWESSPLSVNWSSPVNWNHRLNEGLVVWTLVAPQFSYGLTLRNLVRPSWNFTGTNTEQTDWDTPTGALRPGGWGSINLGGTNEYFGLSAAAVAGYPLTMLCWGRLANITATMTLVALSNSAGDNYAAMNADGNNEYGFDDGCVADPSGPSSLVSGTTNDYTANNWHHFGNVYASTTSRFAYLDGVAGAEDTGLSATPTSWSGTAIGAFAFGGTFGPTTGQLDDVRIYNRALTTDEIRQVIEESKAFYPRLLNRRRRVTYFVPTVAPPGGNRRRRVLIAGAAV